MAKSTTAEEPSTEIVRLYQGEQAITKFDPYAAGAFDSLFSDSSDAIAGHDLLKEELFDELVGVPFAVTCMTFRAGKVHPVTKVLQAYCSFEAVIAPQEMLDRRKINMSAKPFKALDQVVLNDGSTGLYRQAVKYLAGKGYIVLPTDQPEEGPKGFCRYDLPPHLWTDIRVGEFKPSEDGKFIDYKVNVALKADRGIRISDYSNEYTEDGKTRYFA